MATTYSRGFFPGWLEGVDHQHLVDGKSKSHRGFRIGKVLSAKGNSMTISLDNPIKLSPGDGLLWVANQIDSGAQIYSTTSLSGERVKVEFNNDLEVNPEIKGAFVYLNSDVTQKRDLRRTYVDKNVLKRIPVDLTVEIVIGSPLRASMTDGGFTVHAQGKSRVETAQKQTVTDQFLAKELGALGGSVFKLRNFQVQRATDAQIFYSHKELKEVRRELTSALEKLRREHRVWRDETTISPLEKIQAWNRNQMRLSPTRPSFTRLNVLLREKAQVTDFLDGIESCRIQREAVDCVILDYEFGQDYAASIQALKSAKILCGIATTRILKPNEYTHFTRIDGLAPDVILIRNLGALHYFTNVNPYRGELRGDFSLNVSNHLTAGYLLSKGLASLTLSYDLSSEQVSALLETADASRLEATVHQYMPAFHMEHCLFAAFLSAGSSFRDCGKPCEKHRVELKDEFGNCHQIKADPECRNTVFNAVAQSAARYLSEWQERGLGAIRYEALYERDNELISKIRAYQELLSDTKSAAQLVSELQLLETYGLKIRYP
jgi:putative protease